MDDRYDDDREVEFAGTDSIFDEQLASWDDAELLWHRDNDALDTDELEALNAEIESRHLEQMEDGSPVRVRYGADRTDTIDYAALADAIERIRAIVEEVTRKDS